MHARTFTQVKFPLLCKLEELTCLDEPTSGESNVENCLPSPLAISQLNMMLGDQETALPKAPAPEDCTQAPGRGARGPTAAKYLCIRITMPLKGLQQWRIGV